MKKLDFYLVPAFGEFAQDLVAAGVVEVTLGADHVQGTPMTHNSYQVSQY
jgi:hypothetical protein